MIILKPLLNRILYCIPSTAYSLHLFYPLTLPETYPIFFIPFQYFYPFFFYLYSSMLWVYRHSFLKFPYRGGGETPSISSRLFQKLTLYSQIHKNNSINPFYEII
jgi:hypothetical protein